MLVLMHELKILENIQVLSLGQRIIFMWVLVVICWVSDSVVCSWWVSIGFPYLHGAWRALIFLTSYAAIVLCTYFMAKDNVLTYDMNRMLTGFILANSLQLGVPFAELDQGWKEKEVKTRPFIYNLHNIILEHKRAKPSPKLLTVKLRICYYPYWWRYLHFFSYYFF
jgi:hypothetical protein